MSFNDHITPRDDAAQYEQLVRMKEQMVASAQSFAQAATALQVRVDPVKQEEVNTLRNALVVEFSAAFS